MKSASAESGSGRKSSLDSKPTIQFDRVIELLHNTEKFYKLRMRHGAPWNLKLLQKLQLQYQIFNEVCTHVRRTPEHNVLALQASMVQQVMSHAEQRSMNERALNTSEVERVVNDVRKKSSALIF